MLQILKLKQLMLVNGLWQFARYDATLGLIMPHGPVQNYICCSPRLLWQKTSGRGSQKHRPISDQLPSIHDRLAPARWQERGTLWLRPPTTIIIMMSAVGWALHPVVWMRWASLALNTHQISCTFINNCRIRVAFIEIFKKINPIIHLIFVVLFFIPMHKYVYLHIYVRCRFRFFIFEPVVRDQCTVIVLLRNIHGFCSFIVFIHVFFF